MPLVGAFVADQYLGRFRTIMWSILFAIIGHIILIISAIPPVIDNPNGAIGCFAIGLIIMGIGTGGFKCVLARTLCRTISGLTAIGRTSPLSFRNSIRTIAHTSGLSSPVSVSSLTLRPPSPESTCTFT